MKSQRHKKDGKPFEQMQSKNQGDLSPRQAVSHRRTGDV